MPTTDTADAEALTDPGAIAAEINRRFGARELVVATFSLPKQLPHLRAADGFGVSCQASSCHYCMPREDLGPYYRVECGYPTELPPEWAEWAESPGTTDTVFGYIPVNVVAQTIADHGGLLAEVAIARATKREG